MTASVNPSVYGQPVTFSATVSAAAPGAGTPTGTVTFYDGATNLGGVMLSAGSATLSTSALAVGSNLITAVYGGGANFVTSSSSTTNLMVSQASTTTSLSATPSTANSGQTVTLTATIAVVTPGAGTPTGTVQFFVGTTSLGTANISGDTAIFPTTTLPVGTDSLTAEYLGVPDFSGSTSSAVSVTINPLYIATTTTLTSSANPSVFGQSVTFTATVTPASGSGTPTGSVTFYDGSTPLGTATLSAKKASLETTSLPVGAQAITAVYSGDAHYSSSTSAVLTQTIKQASSTTTVISLLSPSVYGQPVTFTATVSASSPGSGTPTGTVTFSVGSTVLGAATISSGSASITTSSPLAAGNDTIKASYGGDTNFRTSAGTVVQTVDQDSTTTSVASSANPSVFGQSVTYTATVRERAGERDARRLRHIHKRLDHAGYSYSKWWFCLLQHYQTGDGPGHDHGHVQRQRQLHHEQREPEPDGQSGRHHHDGHFVAEYVGLRSVGDVFLHG